MVILVIETQPETCPVCRKRPEVIQTIMRRFFVICFDHLETQECATREQAISLWNTQRHEQRERARATRDWD